MEEENSINQNPDTVVEPSKKQSHNEHVRDLALILFDRTRSLHELSENCRRIMEIAALYHHFSAPKTKKGKKPERAIRKGLRKQLDKELSSDDLDMLAVILATHQRKIKRKDYDRLSISPIQQREALTMASLLRIASGLDDSRSQGTTIQQVQHEQDQLWIVVVGPNAASDAAVAQHNARLWSKIGYPKAKVLESADAAEQILLYPTPEDAIGITPTDTLAEAGRKVMRFHFAQLLAEEGDARLGEDLEALHDMRVATRRMRAAFQVFGQAYETGVLKPYRKGLRATGSALGGVRDLDVFADHTSKYLSSQSDEHRKGLNPLLNELAELREAKFDQMLTFLDGQEYNTFKRQFNVFLNTSGAGAPQFPIDDPTPKLVLESAPVLIYTRLAAVRAYDPLVTEADFKTLHAMRIEFRKLRYTIEYFREVLDAEVEEVIEECKIIQDHLGALNDANVATQFIEAYLEKEQSKGDTDNQTAAREYLAARKEERKQLLKSYPDAWNHFNSADLRRKLANALAVL